MINEEELENAGYQFTYPSCFFIKYTFKGESCEAFNEEEAIAYLLLKEDIGYNPNYEKKYCFYVNCNDIFAWGCADAEPIQDEEIYDLAKMVVEDPKWGSAKWCILKRKEMPQWPVLKAMKEDGSWNFDEKTLATLEENYYDKWCKEHYAKKCVSEQEGNILRKSLDDSTDLIDEGELL